MTAPCQFPGCGQEESHVFHSRCNSTHPPILGCHPYVPEEPTSALGYLLGHLDVV